MTEPSHAPSMIAQDAEAVEKAVWVKPVIEDFNSQVEGGSIGGASDVSVFHS
ncbi:MAG: hypothetical protein Q8L23_11290 [Caulobacter sp.]|nr:hypothetical protein [Caulobacter sp.]